MTRPRLAFSILVGRHGGTVLSTCRGVLGNKEDSLDAFQATFLILARKARALGIDDSLAPWLNRVARHAALRAKRSAARRSDRSRRRRDEWPARCRATGIVLNSGRSCTKRSNNSTPATEHPVVLCDLSRAGLTKRAARRASDVPSGQSGAAWHGVASGSGRDSVHRGLGPLVLTGTPLHFPGVRDVITPTLVDLVTRWRPAPPRPVLLAHTRPPSWPRGFSR